MWNNMVMYFKDVMYNVCDVLHIPNQYNDHLLMLFMT